MKECLVIALVLSLTGTVLGQSTSSRSGFDEPRIDSSRTSGQRDLFAQADSAASGSKNFSGQQGPMLLDLNPSLLDQMIGSGEELEAAIVSKDMVNGIVIRFGDANTAKPAVADVPRTLTPSLDSGDGILRFSLDRDGIERLKAEGLQYRYSAAELAKYKSVVLSYKGNETSPVSLINQRSALDSDRDFSSPSRTTSNRFDSLGGATGLDRLEPSSTALGSQPRRDAQDDSRFNRSILNDNNSSTLAKAPRDIENRPRRDLDSFATRPLSQSGFGSNDEITDEERFLARKRELERKQADQRRRQLDLDQGYQPRDTQTSYAQNNRADRTHQFELTDSDIDSVAKSVQQIRDNQDRRAAELELLRRKKEASDREARLANADRLRMMQQLRDRSTLDDTSVVRRRTLDQDDLYTSYDRRHLTPTADRFARVNSRDIRRDQLDRPTDINRISNAYLVGDSSNRPTDAELRDARLRNEQLRNEQLRNELLRAENDNRQLRREQTEFERLNLETHREQTNFGSDALAQTNTRPLQMRDFGASIPGTRRPGDNRVASLNTPQTANVGNTVYSSSSVDHILQQYNGTNYPTNFSEVASRVQQEVAATAASKVRTDKFNGFLLFLFITSFALNLYLAWLAQTFYGRYGELADELRETFTATT